MGTKSIRLDESVYRRVSAYKREDETYSEAIDRLIRGPSLRDLAGVFDEEQVEEMRAAIDEADREDAEEVDDVAARFT